MMSDTEPKYKQADFRLCPQCDKLHTGLTTCPSCSGPLQLIEYSFFIGKTLGKYTIEKVVGVGGMGVVFLALHKTLAKKVALKIFIPRPGDETFEKRFLREARILAGLKHPNIVEVHDFDVSQWGMPYYVMEYLDGQTLGAAIREHPKGMPPTLIDAYLEPIIQALSHAHKRGIIHRDLKPENIFIENFQGKEVVKILDFGIAKSLGSGQDSGNLTATETVLGTPFYLAPEQILNKNIGPHTDQYALALITVEMFSGQAVRGGKNIGEILYSVVHEAGQFEDSILKKIPAKAGQTLVKATMLDTGERFPDIDSFGANVLEALESKAASATTGYERTTVNQTGSATVAKHPSRKTFISIEEEARRQARKKQLLRWAIPAAALLLVVVIVFLLDPFGLRSGEPGAEDAQTVPKAFLTLKKSIKAPTGITGILTYQGDKLVLQDPRGVCLLDMKINADPERFPWEEKILRGLPGGNVVLKANYSITSRNAITWDDELIARNPPPGEAFHVTKSKKYLAVKNGSILTFYRVSEGKFYEIKPITVKTGKGKPGFLMAVNDRCLVYAGGGEIHAYRLDSGKEIFKPLTSEGVPAAAAVSENGDTLAIGATDGTVYLYDLKKGNMVQTFSEPGTTLALEFFPGYPVIIIAREDRLLFREISGAAVGDYREPGLNAADIILTDQGMVVLDKKAEKINIYSYDKSRL